MGTPLASPDRRMPIKGRGRGHDPEIHEWAGGFTWIAHPGERMRRASHALAVEDGSDTRVWVVEPVDAAGIDDRIDALGRPAGVLVTASYHRRDAATIATRHDVPVVVPPPLAHLAGDIDAPVGVVDDPLPGTAARSIPVFGGIPWHEAVLYDPTTGTLVATEALVTSPDLTGADEPLAVSPFVRLRPPRTRLGGLDAERVLVGHGTPVLEDATRHLTAALDRAIRGAPGVWARNLPYLLRAASVAVRD